MRALVAENSLPRLALTRLLAQIHPRAFVGPTSAIRLREVPDPVLPADDWAIARTSLCGLCGSDYKQVFMNGSFDNPMTGYISWPQVLGHEVVGVIERTGPRVTRLRPGDRVVLNPWLSCTPRGIEACRWCREGALAQCENFAKGAIAPGIHSGNSATATGGFAPLVPAHESQWFKIPDGLSDEAAALADPFSVSLHAILRNPPPEGGTALVYGCGTLGLMALEILRTRFPRVRVAAVARFEHQARLAQRFGAARVLAHRPTREIVEGVGRFAGAEEVHPWRGLPVLNGGVDVVYDTVSSPETFEVGVRVLRSRGTLVALGVEPPRRFEWTPLYFKEISITGSNGFGIEEIDGRRRHAMAWYLEWAAAGRVDATPILTHRFALRDYRDAFMTCHAQGEHGAVKVLFDRFDD